MNQSSKDLYELIAEKIGITKEDFEKSLSTIIRIDQIDPDVLEVVKVWKMQQFFPDSCYWWEILIFSSIEDDSGNCYHLYNVDEWGKDNSDIVYGLDSDNIPVKTIFALNNCIVEVLYEDDSHGEEGVYDVFSEEEYF